MYNVTAQITSTYVVPVELDSSGHSVVTYQNIGGGGSGMKIVFGGDDPEINPPAGTFASGDIYIKQDGVVYRFNGTVWQYHFEIIPRQALDATTMDQLPASEYLRHVLNRVTINDGAVVDSENGLMQIDFGSGQWVWITADGGIGAKGWLDVEPLYAALGFGNGNAKVLFNNSKSEMTFGQSTIQLGSSSASMWSTIATLILGDSLTQATRYIRVGTSVLSIVHPDIVEIWSPSVKKNNVEIATVTDVANAVVGVGRSRGEIDCSTNPNFPAGVVGDRYEVSVAGKIGGASGRDVDVWNEIVCIANTAAGDFATVGANWYVIQGDIDQATETVFGYVKKATTVEAQALTDNLKYLTPYLLAQVFAKPLNLTGAGSDGKISFEHINAGLIEALGFLRFKGGNAVADIFGDSATLRIGGDANGTAGNGVAVKAYNGSSWVTVIRALNAAGLVVLNVDEIAHFAKRVEFLATVNTTATGTVDWDLSKSAQEITLTGDTTITLTNKPTMENQVGNFILFVKQGGTGSYTLGFTAGEFRNVPTTINPNVDDVTVLYGTYFVNDGRMLLSTTTDTTAN